MKMGDVRKIYANIANLAIGLRVVHDITILR